MQRFVNLGAGIVVAFLVLATVAYGDEEKVALDKVPAPVLQTANARFPKAEITEAAKEVEDGKTVFELSLKFKGKTIDVILTPEGEIVLFEVSSDVKELPPAVVQSLEAKYPKSALKTAEQVFKVVDKKEKFAFYEVVLTTADKQKLAVEISHEGKILEEEKKGSEQEGK